MGKGWKVVVEEELDCQTLAVYVNGVEVGRYEVVEDPEAERRDLAAMIQACVNKSARIDWDDRMMYKGQTEREKRDDG